MERREEAETYHPAVHTQRRQQIVCTLDEVLRVPLIAQHHVLRGSLAFRLRRRLASRNTPSVVRLVCAALCAVAPIVLSGQFGRDNQLNYGPLDIVSVVCIVNLLLPNSGRSSPLLQRLELHRCQLRLQSLPSCAIMVTLRVCRSHNQLNHRASDVICIIGVCKTLFVDAHLACPHLQCLQLHCRELTA